MRQLSSKDLQELVKVKIITPEAAQQIEQYFNDKKTASPSKLNLVFGILGALLVSLSIVLFIAHNWDQLNKTTKTIFAFLPLVIGQALCLFTLLYRKESKLWREASAIVWFFAVPASISLVSQVYHIDGTLEDFLLTWILLAAAIIYIMQSTATAHLLIAVASWYATRVTYFHFGKNSIPWPYLAVLIFLLPQYYNYARYKRESNFFHWYNWSLAVSSLVCLGCFSGPASLSERILLIGYLALLTLFYQTGKYAGLPNKFFANPYLKLGVPGIIAVLLILSFEDSWRFFDKSTSWASPFIYITVVLFCICTYLFIKRSIKKQWRVFDPMEISLYIVGISFLINSVVSVFIINGWLLLIALWYILRGSAQNNFGILNFGLLIITVLAIMRFFDDEIPFAWRGLFFLVTGIGFFAANYNLVRRRRIAQKNIV